MSKAVVAAAVLMVAGAMAAAPAVLPARVAPQVQVQVLAGSSEPGGPTAGYGTCYYTRSCGGGGGQQ